jgi:fumarylacetoacetase
VTDTWLSIPDASPFSVDNLPWGVFSGGGRGPRVGVAIGDHVLDLAGALDDDVFARPSLNAFMARGPAAWTRTREQIQDLLTGTSHHDIVVAQLSPIADATLHLPIEVADYVDFFSSIHHAENLGRIFRPGGEALSPNWRHLPAGYHGRAGTIVVSGTPIVRPSGQRQLAPAEPPTYGPSLRLDIEAEIGFIVGRGSTLGQPVPTDAFADHVFGVVVINDWSARDIQAWESAPLGPFLGKSFATSMSPWVVPLDALAGARVQPPAQDPPPLPYRPPFAGMYWTPAQQLAHLTANGASVRTGDVFASGTVSGLQRSEWGSLIELTENGVSSVKLADGSVRTFLDDGDTVAISASAPALHGGRLGFGEVTGTILPPFG